MNTPRLALLAGSFLVLSLALAIGATSPAAAATPDTTLGSHVSSCAQGTGFDGQHNPSHHRDAAAHHMDCMHS